MNKNKIFFLFIGILSLVLASCSDDDDYKWASAEGEQVYFSKDLGSTVTVSKDASSVAIPVNRVNTKGSVTVPLKVSGADTTIYNVPTSVTFNDGEATANINVTYDPAKVVYGTYNGITVAVGDSVYSTPYGLSSYEFRIGATEWGEWHHYNSAHTASWYYQYAYSGVDQQDFQIRQSVIDPNKYQFQMTHVLNDVTVIFNYDKSTSEFSVGPTYIGEMYQNSLPIYIADLNYYVENVQKEDNPHYKGTFDEEQGILRIPVVYYCSAGIFGYGYEEIWIDGYNRADYTTSGTYLGKLTNEKGEPSKVYFNVELGKNVESANVALVAGEQVDSTTLAKIVDGSYTPLQQITASGEISFDAQDLEDGKYTLVIVPFANNTAETASASTVTFDYVKGAVEQYVDIAAGTLTLGAKDVSPAISSDGSAWGTFPEALGLSSSVTQEAVLSQSDQDATKFKLTPFWQDGYELSFSVQADGSIVVDHVDTGIGTSSHGNVLVTDMGTRFGLTLAQANSYGIASYVNGNNYYFTLIYATADNSYYAAETETFVVSSTGAKALKAAQKVAAAKAKVSAAKKVVNGPTKIGNNKRIRHTLGFPKPLKW